MRRFHVTTPWVHDEDTTRDVIKRALELGINFIDTANVYSHGTSKEFIGRSLKNLGSRVTTSCLPPRCTSTTALSPLRLLPARSTEA